MNFNKNYQNKDQIYYGKIKNFEKYQFEKLNLDYE
jgi:hypothetical protein